MTILKLPTELGLDEAIHYTELQSGTINLCEDIGPFSARDAIRDMEYATMLRTSTPSLTLFINSDGGGIYDALAIHDCIIDLRNQGVDIRGVVRGRAASAASMIVLQATKPRIATPYSRLHLHEPSKWAHGPEKVSAIQDDAEELSRLHSVVLSILAYRTEKGTEEIRKELERREVWMSAEEAKDWGLIDWIGPR